MVLGMIWKFKPAIIVAKLLACKESQNFNKIMVFATLLENKYNRNFSFH